MDIMNRLACAGVVPVVVLEDAVNAVPTARAMVAGGIDVMEITFRTAAARDSIAAVAKECPDMLVGAGTIITLEQCKTAVEAGAKFIVSPGFNPEVVNSSNFATPAIEVMKSMYLGKNGHIAIRTNSMTVALAEMEKRGFVVDMQTAKYKGERMIAVYLRDSFGGFAVHLLQK